MKKISGFIELKHNTDGTPREKGDGKKICWGSGYRVNLSENAVITGGNTVVISRCPNPDCLATNLVVSRIMTVIE